MFKSIAYISLFIAPLLASATTKIYQWTDVNGNVHFGDHPPAQGNANELNFQGTRQSSINIDEDALSGEWFGNSDAGGQVKFTFNDNGTVRYLQTKADQSVYNYNGIWTLTNRSLTVITEMIDTADKNGNKLKRNIEPLQLTYNIIRHTPEESIELIIEGERLNLQKINSN